MRKVTHTLGLVVITAFVVAFSGCASRPRNRTFDRDIPREETTRVLINESIFVTEVNGIPVRWYGLLRRRNYIRARLPAGETHLLFNMSHSVPVVPFSNNFVVFRQNDLELLYHFASGREYTIGFYVRQNEDATRSRTLLLGIWEGMHRHNLHRRLDQLLIFWEIGDF